MNNSTLLRAKTAVPFRAAEFRGETARKKRPRFLPRNPLKSLDSDERIQGNPRKSNSHKLGFHAEKTRDQENPNGSTATALLTR
jgi:hypothetical protein